MEQVERIEGGVERLEWRKAREGERMERRKRACAGVELGAKSQVAKRRVMSSDLQFHYRVVAYR